MSLPVSAETHSPEPNLIVASGDLGAAPPEPSKSSAAGAAAPIEKSEGPSESTAGDSKLERLLSRIHQLREASQAQTTNADRPSDPPLAGSTPTEPTHAPESPATAEVEVFLPNEPTTWEEAQLQPALVEGLCLKFLLSVGSASGVEIAEQAKISFTLLQGLLHQLKADQLVYYRGGGVMGDYEYQLTEMGRERARRMAEHCSYSGAAPVALSEYIASVGAQSLTCQHPTADDLHKAFHDLLLDKKMLDRLGPAINSGRGLFLYGAAGNGKTSIAERVTAAFGSEIWIPRAIGVDGEIIRLYDPSTHEEVSQPRGGLLDARKVDRRWIRIRRPTIVVGGELTMASLEVSFNPASGVCEAPLQMKSNCGTLVIDDFGRQRMSTDELLNRWIVPLEKRYDYLNLPSGKKVQVPFDQLIVFSTNLQPKDLVDDAFLRRIPYKIDVIDPDESQFRELFRLVGPKLGFVYNEEAVDYLIRTHYLAVGRPFRCCQPRDLLLQIRNHCHYQSQPVALSPEAFDFAVANYFAVM
ncbi:MAG TPA: AAA family ATPase [Pirellulales bacterium]|jgi:DNA replication protein DnaC